MLQPVWCSVFDPVGDGQRRHTRWSGAPPWIRVGAVDRPGLQVVFGHAETLLDVPQLVVGVDDELRCCGGEVGGVALLISTSG